MRRLLSLTLAAVVTFTLTGCLGTLVQAPTRSSKQHLTTRVHLIAAPTHIDAHVCPMGMSEVFTYVPLWGVAVGILTIGIIVPMTTVYTCVPAK